MSTCFTDMTQLFAVGGYPHAYYKSEVVDLSGRYRNCQEIADFPLNEGSTGTFLPDGPFVCGGVGPSALIADCYSYNSTGNRWDLKAQMNRRRYYAASVMYNSTHWWITGGWSDITGAHKSTELYDINTMTFSMFVDLPMTRDFHNMVKINETHIMLVGNGFPTALAWMFNQNTEEWIQLPSTVESKSETFAGLVTFNNGSQIVIVAGGYPTKTAEAFDLQEQNWIKIPDLPVVDDLYDGSSVPFGETFLIVGGGDSGNGSEQKTIIQYDPIAENWTIRQEELELERYRFTSFLVPDDYVVCN